MPETFSNDPGLHSLADSVQVGNLCAYYGKLLTPLQLEAVRLHYMEDLSLSEIASLQSSTRQSVHEAIKRSVLKLQEYEAKLHLVEKSRRLAQMLEEARSLSLSKGDEQMLALIDQMIHAQEGEDAEYGL